MKFGGTSVGSRSRIRDLAPLVNTGKPTCVIVSAMAGTTDTLIELGALAERGSWPAVQAGLAALQERHIAASPEPLSILPELFTKLQTLLSGVSQLREQTHRSRALLASFGERLSAPICAAWLRDSGLNAKAVDARQLICTRGSFVEGEVDFQTTQQRCASLKALVASGVVPVVTGFVASTADGITTLLGRGGSDYSASILGAALNAEEVWIWTDVDGILTADPRWVSEATTLSSVSYAEAAEMSFFGAKVLHPKTMKPVSEQGIPIRIRSTFAPQSGGTVVSAATVVSERGAKVVTTMRELCCLTVFGSGMAGLVGVARRIFEAAATSEANVVMISQASSEQAVSLIVSSDSAQALIESLEEQFALEISNRWIDGIRKREDVAILSIIGEGMAGQAGVSGRLFGALGVAGVNVLAIAQGANERSISVAIAEDDARRAVRSVHTAFGLTRVAHLVVVGATGRVGRTFIAQLDQTREALAKRGVTLKLIGVLNSTKEWFEADGLEPSEAITALVHHGRKRTRDWVNRLAQLRLVDVVVVDATASDTFQLQLLALKAGLHVVSANKVPLSSSTERYEQLTGAARRARARIGYETTFGAGLPVLHTLQELIATGDQIQSISGCFSGTLGFLCSALDDDVSLKDAVQMAEDKGFTEPDPREDLSGRDVARKALIIARSLGRTMEPEQVRCEPLVPGLEQGLAPALDAYTPILAARVRAARERGEVLRYVAEIGEEVVVSLREVPADSPIGSLRGPDNILVFRTQRYDDNPLVIRGPGAGAEVTAAGVLADVLRIVRPLD